MLRWIRIKASLQRCCKTWGQTCEWQTLERPLLEILYRFPYQSSHPLWDQYVKKLNCIIFAYYLINFFFSFIRWVLSCTPLRRRKRFIELFKSWYRTTWRSAKKKLLMGLIATVWNRKILMKLYVFAAYPLIRTQLYCCVAILSRYASTTLVAKISSVEAWHTASSKCWPEKSTWKRCAYSNPTGV